MNLQCPKCRHKFDHPLELVVEDFVDEPKPAGVFRDKLQLEWFPVVPGTIHIHCGSETYYDRDGKMFHAQSTEEMGTVDYVTGQVVFTCFNGETRHYRADYYYDSRRVLRQPPKVVQRKLSVTKVRK
jgi:hypothetical protein